MIVANGRRLAGLGLEAGPIGEAGCQFWTQHLQGDAAVQPFVISSKNEAEGTAAHLGRNVVRLKLPQWSEGRGRSGEQKVPICARIPGLGGSRRGQPFPEALAQPVWQFGSPAVSQQLPIDVRGFMEGCVEEPR